MYGSAAAVDDTATGIPVTVMASVDKNTITIGDKVRYTIQVKTRKDIDVRFPDFAQIPDKFAVKDFGSSEGGMFGKKRLVQWYILDTYETGTFTIPGPTIRYREKGDKEWKEAAAEEIRIEVKSVLGSAAEETDIRDIKGPLSIQNWIYLYILLAVLALIVITVLVVLFLKKRKKPKEIIIPPVPAHEIAYKALAELMNKDYLKKGRVQEYYFELSNIVRHYVENRFRLRAPEMTTEEFLSALRDSDRLNSGQKGIMREFLSHCDMVKFAKYLPDEKEAESSYESARKLVDQTKE